MTAGYVSGETMLRPIRMGLAITPGSATGLQRAIALATRTWGGQAFPIFEAGRDDLRVLRMAAAMGVDCLFPVGDDDESKVLGRGARRSTGIRRAWPSICFRRRPCMTGTVSAGCRCRPFIMFPGRRTTNSLTC
jgi:hypothetical protein